MINNGEGTPKELDCASNNGVDHMRAIQEDCSTRPLHGKYKIFILDEVHMISTAGWNSMLKILEEPPEYVIFLFATTDPQKIPGTILSRVQRFNFSRISVSGIYNRLKYILEEEHIAQYEDEAVDYIARISRGGMRDAITTLEKCLDYDSNLSMQNVLKVTSGGLQESTLLDFLKLMLNKDAKQALIKFNEIYMTGIDMSLFLKLYIEFLQNSVKYMITQDKEIVTLSNFVLDWLIEYRNYLGDIKVQLVNLIRLQNIYNIQDLKIMLESWIIQECL